MKKIFDTLKSVVKSKRRPLMTSFLLLLTVVGYQNCQRKDQFFAIQTDELRISASEEVIAGDNGGLLPAEVKVEEEKSLCADGSSADLICNPFGATNPAGPITTTPDVPSVPARKLGLIAQIYEGQNQWSHMGRYFTEGYKHDEYVYFSNFDIPTRDFSRGFGFDDKDYLKNRNGEKLVEWFAFKAVGHIALPDSEDPGSYHIVTISDDGVRITVSGKEILDNSYQHSSTVDCANSLIEFSAKEEKDFELMYFQGPRTEISLMTFIKKIDDPSNFKNESACPGQQSPAELVKRGYKVISPAWFTLPDGF